MSSTLINFQKILFAILFGSFCIWLSNFYLFIFSLPVRQLPKYIIFVIIFGITLVWSVTWHSRWRVLVGYELVQDQSFRLCSWWKTIRAFERNEMMLVKILLDSMSLSTKPHEQQNLFANDFTTTIWISIVPDPGMGECADPVNGAAILGKEGPDPREGNKGRQLSPDKGGEKTWEDDERPRMTTPAWLRDASMHRVSWCA